jgi:gliding motility-associated-like protein
VVLKQQDALQGPEVITPNDDGKNDCLVFRGVNPKQSNRLTVLDRTGEVKYTMDDYKNDWSGKDKKGQTLTQGVYYYVFINGDHSVKGFFEVLY